MIQLCRHAQSVSNAGARVENPKDAPLSDLGTAHAHELAARFDAAPDLIVVSDSLRTQLTVAPLMEKFPGTKMEIWPVHEFYFIRNYRIKNTTTDERRAMLMEYFAKNDPDFVDGPGCESFNQFVARIRDFLGRLDRSKNILVISHGHFVNGVKMLVNNIPPSVENFGKLEYVEHVEMMEI